MSGPKVSDEQRKQVLDAVAIGVHPDVACTAAGLNNAYYRLLRSRAKRGDAGAIEFYDAIQAASARAELADVEAVARATKPIENKPLQCPHCDAEYEVEPETLALWVAKLTDVAKAKGVAGELALKKLERRHPKRWSQKVIHTVQEEHERLLDVCQRVLAPEVFESLLEEYLSGEQCESETPAGQGEQAGGGVH